MARVTAVVSVALLLLPLMGGCAVPAVPAGSESRTPDLQAMVDAARADAARRFGLPPAAFTIAGAEAVTWSDGSIGCPQPGMGYTQALVPGARIRLRGPAGELDYHAGPRGGLTLCPPGQAVDPVPDSGRI